MFDTTDIQRITVSAIGAIALTAASVFVAAAPVRAETGTSSIADWEARVGQQVDGAEDPRMLAPMNGRVQKVVVKARFTAAGEYEGARIAQSSGNPAIDRAALNVVDHVDYPALPAAYRGTPREVTMRIAFGESEKAVAAAHRQRAVTYARNQVGGGVQLAAR